MFCSLLVFLSTTKSIKRCTAPAYLAFVNGHDAGSNGNAVWWEDDNWISNSNNINFDINWDEVIDALIAKLPANAAEKALIKIHPIQAWNVYLNSRTAQKEAKKLYPLGSPDNPLGRNLNENGDAFRHCYWNALNEQMLGSDPTNMDSYAKQFADAHESEVPPVLQLEKTMDLHNNNVGRIVGNSISLPQGTPQSQINTAIINLVKSKMASGALRHLSPLDFNISPLYNVNCSNCLDGIYSGTLYIPTN